MSNRRWKFKPKRSVRSESPIVHLPSIPTYSKSTSRELHVWNEFWSGVVVWCRHEGIWFVRQTDPPLKWMIGLDKLTAKIELLKRGCSWEWSDIKPRNDRVTQNNGALNSALSTSSKVHGPLEKWDTAPPNAPMTVNTSSIKRHSPEAQGTVYHQKTPLGSMQG